MFYKPEMDYFENIHYYPLESEFNVCLASQNVKRKIRNKCIKFKSVKIIHVLLYIFGNSDYLKLIVKYSTYIKFIIFKFFYYQLTNFISVEIICIF